MIFCPRCKEYKTIVACPYCPASVCEACDTVPTEPKECGGEAEHTKLEEQRRNGN